MPLGGIDPNLEPADEDDAAEESGDDQPEEDLPDGA
jgi:hypothetical protein